MDPPNQLKAAFTGDGTVQTILIGEQTDSHGPPLTCRGLTLKLSVASFSYGRTLNR